MRTVDGPGGRNVGTSMVGRVDWLKERKERRRGTEGRTNGDKKEALVRSRVYKSDKDMDAVIYSLEFFSDNFQ